MEKVRKTTKKVIQAEIRIHFSCAFPCYSPNLVVSALLYLFLTQ